MPDPFLSYSNPEVFIAVPELSAGIDALSLNERGELVGWEWLGDVTALEITQVPAAPED
jgi:hypothetical protein